VSYTELCSGNIYSHPAFHASSNPSATRKIAAFFQTPCFAIDGKYPQDYLVSQLLATHTGDLRNGKKTLFHRTNPLLHSEKMECSMTERFSIRNWPEGERPREKLIHCGAETLTDAELLAILLRVGNEGASAIDMGRLLITELGGLQGVDRAHAEELMRFKGLGIAKTAQLKAAIEMGKRVRRLDVNPTSFDSAEAIAQYCYPKFENKRHEQFIALLLDGQNHLLAERLIAEGIPTQSVVYTRKVMEEALRLSASAIVVVHNHPSGEAAPSEQDEETTRKLKQAADVLEILLQDHIIIGRECYYSFLEHGNILT
jgi:DNA repair protein RadC